MFIADPGGEVHGSRSCVRRSCVGRRGVNGRTGGCRNRKRFTDGLLGPVHNTPRIRPSGRSDENPRQKIKSLEESCGYPCLSPFESSTTLAVMKRPHCSPNG